MQQHASVSRVLSLNCDHSPFFSAPGQLVGCLESVVEETR
jgi:hypothetical protein